MPRNHFILLIVFISGLLLPLYLHELIELSTLLTTLVLLSFFQRRFLVRVLICFTLATLISTWQISQRISHQFDATFEGRDLLIEGRIESVTRRPPKILSSDVNEKTSTHSDAPRYLRFEVIVERLRLSGDEDAAELSTLNGQRVRLSWRQGKDDTVGPEVGQRWHLQVKLKRPRGFVNPGGFDYQAWLLAKDIMATGYVKVGDPALNFQSAAADQRLLERSRATLETAMFAHPTNPHSAILRALLLGDKSAISPSQWKVLRATGTAHLMAISGLHIGLVAFFGFYLARVIVYVTLLLVPVFRLKSYCALRFIPPLCSLLFSGFYAGLSGFSVPTQRAWIIVVAVNLAYLFGRRCSGIYILLCVASYVLIVNPLAATQAGFWLSFTAVFFLLFYFAYLRCDNKKILSVLKAQLVVFVGLLVALSALGIPVSESSPLANVVAVPWMSFVVIPLLFLSAILHTFSEVLGAAVYELCILLFHFLWEFLAYLSQHSHSFTIAQPNLWQIVLGLVAVFLLLSHKVLRVQGFGLGLILVFLFNVPEKHDGLEVLVLDVGQGLAIVMHTKNHTLVYDVGAKFSENFDIGGVIAKYLKHKGIETLDLVIVSHGDNDHLGGLSGLVSEIKIGQLAYNAEANYLGQRVGCRAGDQWAFDGVALEVLWPPTERGITDNDNNDSCVVLVKHRSFSMLLTGDIEKKVEHDLLEQNALPSGIDVLVAPHHGSRTSSSAGFIAHLAPRHAVVSSGYKNRYRHPAAIVSQRYLEHGVKVWRTDTGGSINVLSQEQGGLIISQARETLKRPWHSAVSRVDASY